MFFVCVFGSVAFTRVKECGNFQYTLYPQDMTFKQACEKCEDQEEGWTVAMPRNLQENMCVYTTMIELRGTNKGSIWLGFVRHFKRPFKGLDGQPIGETFWYKDHPKRHWSETGPIMWDGAKPQWKWGDEYHSWSQRHCVVCQRGE